MSTAFGRKPLREEAETVTRRLALRHFWNLRRMAEIEKRTSEPVYQILNPANGAGRLLPRIETIRVTKWLRFGNAVRQLRQASRKI